MSFIDWQLIEPLKWAGFSLLNRVADLRGGSARSLAIHYPAGGRSERPLIWVFCSTIGEVHACKPFLDRVAELGQMVLITDRFCYHDSYRRHYPDAVVVELSGRHDDGARLAAALPPTRFIVCEIPALPVDAPCRLSYGVLRAARRAGALCHLVNGWLYHYTPSCRMDALAERLFSRPYLRSFTALTTQTDAVREALLARGVEPGCVQVAGNMKFDALNGASPQSGGDSARLIERLSSRGWRLFVAGCLTDIWEYQLVLEAFARARRQDPGLYLVLALRHPEYPEQMSGLAQLLAQYGLPHAYRSRLDSAEALDQTQLLVLDTFGELKAFYAASALSYVGLNHNVLEPLAYGRRVLVGEGWEPTYPSYPVYLMTRELELLEECIGVEALTAALLRAAEPESERQQRVRERLAALSGAVEKNMEVVFGSKGAEREAPLL